MGLELVKDMVFRDSAYNAQKYLWFFFLYVITGVPVMFMAYVEIYINIMYAKAFVGTKFAAVYSYLYIIVGIAFLGASYLLHGFIKNIGEALAVLGIRLKKLYKLVPLLGLVIAVINIAGGTYLLYNIDYFSNKIGAVTDPKDIVGSIVKLPELIHKDVFLAALNLGSLIAITLFLLLVATVFSSIKKATGIRDYGIAGLLIALDAVVILLYTLFLRTAIILGVLIVILAVAIIVLAKIALQIPKTLTALYTKLSKQ